MKNINLYSEAHLFVAAIRILEHSHKELPPIEEIADRISYSKENAMRLGRKLKELEIIEEITGPFGSRFSIQDHLKIEDIPKDNNERQLDRELKKFQSSDKKYTQKIAELKAAQKQQKKDLHAELERKFKEKINQHKPDEA